VARPCWPHLAVIVLLGLLSTPLTLLAPLPIKICSGQRAGDTRTAHVDALPARADPMVQRGNGALAICATLLVAIALLNCLQSLASWLLCTYTGEKLVHDFRGQLLFHAQRLSLSVHDGGARMMLRTAFSTTRLRSKT